MYKRHRPPKCSKCNKPASDCRWGEHADDYCLDCRGILQKERTDRYRLRGLCRCGKAPQAEKKVCDRCLSTAKRRNRKLKIEAMQAYGGKCLCPGGCDVSDVDFLTIDHIDGDGADQRKEKPWMVGQGIYLYLKRNNYPNGYRPLCWNCNVSRYQFGRCPHERTSLDSTVSPMQDGSKEAPSRGGHSEMPAM